MCAVALLTASGCGLLHRTEAKAATVKAVAVVNAVLPVDLTRVQPNELGMVPIIMYHDIKGKKPHGLAYPPAMFRQDLDWLYAHNYRPISLTQFVHGRIDSPAGMSPVILTFDDGLRSQCNYLGDNQLDPDCAVGIMQAFHDQHPDWPTRATFFVLTDEDPRLPPPFYQKEYAQEKMQFLVQNGYDIGNHTVHHLHMNRLGDTQVVSEIAGAVEGIHKYLPDYNVETIALPYGDFPKNRTLLVTGTANGITYHNLCAMNAAWMPSASPYLKGFDLYHIMRMTAGARAHQSRWWLDYLETNKAEKYISDGDPNTVTVPASAAGQVWKARLGKWGLHLRTYRGTALVATTT
ncbi:MAG: polysaccharide deacetylase family protein [Capsulimonadaceae bacterium]